MPYLRGYGPTRFLSSDFGRRMQPHLGHMVEQAKAAETVAKDFRLLNQEPIRLGVMSTIGPMRLTALFAAFEQQSPGVDTTARDGAPEALAAQLYFREILYLGFAGAPGPAEDTKTPSGET